MNEAVLDIMIQTWKQEVLIGSHELPDEELPLHITKMDWYKIGLGIAALEEKRQVNKTLSQVKPITVEEGQAEIAAMEAEVDLD